MTKDRFILDYINAQGLVSVSDICRHLDVSESTARRAISRLKDESKIINYRGGAISLNDQPLPTRDSWHERRDAKTAIACSAAQIIENNSTIILLGGSTVAMISDFIKNKHLTVITNSVMVLLSLHHAQNIKIIMLGGLYSRDSLEVGGMLTSIGLRRLRADFLFMGATTFNDKDGFITEDTDSIEQYNVCLDAAAKACVVADSSKFKYGGTTVIARPNQIQYLFTDSGLPDYAKISLSEKGINIITSE